MNEWRVLARDELGATGPRGERLLVIVEVDHGSATVTDEHYDEARKMITAMKRRARRRMRALETGR